MFAFQRCSILLIICTYLCLINGFITAVHPMRNNVAYGRPLTTMAMSEASKLTIPKNYNVAIGSIATSAALIFGAHNIIAGIPFVLLSLLLFIQAGKVRFVFDDEALEIFVARKNDQGEVENASRENYVVGGKNRWKYSTFTDWYFIPSKSFPILMYFKENQTSAEGQVHLFPVIMDGKMLYETMMKKVGSISPKV